MLLQRWEAKIRWKESSPQPGIELRTTRSWVRQAHHWTTRAGRRMPWNEMLLNRAEALSNAICLFLFIYHCYQLPIRETPLGRQLVVTGDSVKIQDKTTKSSACSLTCSVHSIITQDLGFLIRKTLVNQLLGWPALESKPQARVFKSSALPTDVSGLVTVSDIMRPEWILFIPISTIMVMLSKVTQTLVLLSQGMCGKECSQFFFFNSVSSIFVCIHACFLPNY